MRESRELYVLFTRWVCDLWRRGPLQTNDDSLGLTLSNKLDVRRPLLPMSKETSDFGIESSSSRQRLMLRRRQAEKASSNETSLSAEAVSFTPSEEASTGGEACESEKKALPSEKKQQTKKKNKKKNNNNHHYKQGSNKESEQAVVQFSCLICADDKVKFVAFGKCDHHICSLCAFRMRFKSREFFCAICKTEMETMTVCPVTYSNGCKKMTKASSWR